MSITPPDRQLRSGTQRPMRTISTAGPGRPVVSFPIVFAILGLLTVIWSFASPLMSVPDESAHAIRAASVARGELLGDSSGQQSEQSVVQVPGYIADLREQECYAFKAEVPADCAPPIDASDTELRNGLTSAGNYNPVYYLLVGLPTLLLSGAPAVYAMRILSGLIGVAFLASALWAAGRLRKPTWPVTAGYVAVTPMVLFLNASINPNALEIVTAAAFLMNAFVVFEKHRTLSQARMNLVLVAVSGAVLANTRPVSLLWLALAAAAVIAAYGVRPLASIFRDRLSQAMIVLLALGCALSLGWLVWANSLKSLLGNPTDVSPGTAAAIMFDRTFDYATGYVGVMGWLDTQLPAGVYMFWYLLMGAVLLAGLSARPARGRIGVYLLAAAALAIPPVMQAQVIRDLGWIWQGRYLLALVVMLLLTCGVAFRFHPFPASPWARGAAKWLLAGAVAAHAYAFLYTLRRYTVGLQDMVRWNDMFQPLWQPPLGWPLLTLAYAVVLAAGALLVYRQLFASTPVAGRRKKTEPAPDADLQPR